MNSEVITIIFSKNRACQLELLLRSLNIPVTVLYTHDPDFKAGYDKLIGMYPSVKFVRELDFKTQLLEIIGQGGEFVMFLVDDDIMIQPFHEDCLEFTEFKRNSDIICLSLRMSPDYLYRGCPVLENNKWEWKPYSHGGLKFSHRLRNWGFPMAVGAHIFRREDILPRILPREMKTPNYLEAALNVDIPDRPLMICFNKSKVINNMANQVQTDFPCQTLGISTKELEERFLNGERLSLEDIMEKASTAGDYFLKTEYKWENSQ